MAVSLKRLSPPALCALIAVLGGLASGAAAVHGLRPNSYGPTNSPVLTGRDDSAGYTDSGYRDGGYGDSAPAGCSGCSERDLGYRWATLQAIRSSAECPNDSWGFRRGCLDYTGGV